MATSPADRRYTVRSLERGLTILRMVHDTDGPVRNNDAVSRTGLPKATVSRLMHTLTELGYLRRIDLGSYVLGERSAAPGRTMLAALRLEELHRNFHLLIEGHGAQIFLNTEIASRVVAVFRWGRDGCGPLDVAESPYPAAVISSARVGRLATADPDPAGVSEVDLGTLTSAWNGDLRQFVLALPVDSAGIGEFVISAIFSFPSEPLAADKSALSSLLRDAARTMLIAWEEQSG